MRQVKRAALPFTPKQPYLDWANSLDEDAPKIGVDFWPEKNVYLIEDLVDVEVDVAAIVAPYFQAIFEDELNSWHGAPSDWPAKRDLTTFLDWFDVEIHSIVLEMRSRWFIPTEQLPPQVARR